MKKKKWRQTYKQKKNAIDRLASNRVSVGLYWVQKKMYRSRFFFSHKQAISYPSNVHKNKIAIVDISHLDHFHHSTETVIVSSVEKNRAKISLLRHSYAIIMQFLVQWSLIWSTHACIFSSFIIAFFIYLYGHHLLLGKCQMSFRYVFICAV